MVEREGVRSGRYQLNAARDLGMTPVMWNTMTDDWKERSGERIAQRIGEKVDALGRRGIAANVVLHDGGHQQRGRIHRRAPASVQSVLDL